MVISDSNKGSYFLLEITPESYMGGLSQTLIEERIENSMDLVLSSMGTTDTVYKFKSKSNKIIYLFSTFNRKRKGQLNKIIEKNIKDSSCIEEYKTTAFLKSEFQECISKFRYNKNIKLISEPIGFSDYDGDDIKIFKKRENWHSWQTELYQQLFSNTGSIYKPDTRKIFFHYDEQGNQGKSSFLKYLYTKNPDSIAKISPGSVQQLNSSIINMGPKKIYFIDIPRSKDTKFNDGDLLHALEELKNGFIVSPMYGKAESLVMAPPHVLIFSNYIFKDSGLSKDRWVIKEVKNYKLKDITKKVLNNEFKEEFAKK